MDRRFSCAFTLTLLAIQLNITSTSIMTKLSLFDKDANHTSLLKNTTGHQLTVTNLTNFKLENSIESSNVKVDLMPFNDSLEIFGSNGAKHNPKYFEEPKSTIEKPKSIIEEPKPTIEEPKSIIEESKSTVENSKSIIEEPKSEIEEPKSENEEPNIAGSNTVFGHQLIPKISLMAQERASFSGRIFDIFCEGYIKCGFRCVTTSQICDGVNNCKSGEDEKNCPKRCLGPFNRVDSLGLVHISTQFFSFDDAIAYCRSLGAELISAPVNMQDLLSYFRNVAQIEDGRKAVWIGMKKTDEVREYKWISNGEILPIDSPYWLNRPQQPANQETSNICIEILIYGSNHGLNDRLCSRPNSKAMCHCSL